jgi:ubiquinone biosynthesis protein
MGLPDRFTPKFYKMGVRAREVAAVFVKHGFFWVAEALEVTRYFPRSLREKIVTTEDYKLPVAVRIRRVIEELGPTYIKAGQILSSRPDLIPPDILKELAKLQDDVPPFPYELVQDVIESELKTPMDRVFRSFARVPIASASIGQVHEAVLRNGLEVVVKVQRPDIEQIVFIDTDLMHAIASYAEKRFQWARLYNFVERVDEFTKTIRQEMDYTIEGQNADRLRRNFEDDDTIYVPEIFWDCTTRRVLTMEYIHGVKIKDKDKLLARGCDLTYLTEVIGNAYIKMILIDGFFHGDPHMGNIFVMDNQVVALIDFGMVGIVDPIMRRNMARYFIAIVNQDAEGLVEVLGEIATIDPGTDRAALVREVGRLMSKYSDVTIGQIKLEAIVLELFDLSMKHRITMPGEFTLMDKTLITLEGLGRHLDPDFDLIGTAEPAARMLLQRELDPRNFGREAVKVVLDTRDLFTALPRRINKITRSLEQGRFQVRLDMEQYSESVKSAARRVSNSVNRLALAIVLAAVILLAAQIIPKDQVVLHGWTLGQITLAVLALLAMILTFTLLRSSRR